MVILDNSLDAKLRAQEFRGLGTQRARSSGGWKLLGLRTQGAKNSAGLEPGGGFGGN